MQLHHYPAAIMRGGLVVSLAACGALPRPPDPLHLHAPAAAARADIPAPVASGAFAAKPRKPAKTETYSVTVNNVKGQELLFAVARDAKLNVDIHPGIQGTVTLNAVDQTLQQLLQRIAKQIDMRWELDGDTLAVMPDTPFLRTYKVDYVNLSREASGAISANSQISTGVDAGSVKVLSSPRLSVLNNQAALLKVVENKVYFTVKADLAAATVTGGQATKAITTTPQSVCRGRMRRYV